MQTKKPNFSQAFIDRQGKGRPRVKDKKNVSVNLSLSTLNILSAQKGSRGDVIDRIVKEWQEHQKS